MMLCLFVLHISIFTCYLVCRRILPCMPRRQPRRLEELFGSPQPLSTQKTCDITSAEAASSASEASRPSQKNHSAGLSCLLPATATHQTTITSVVPLPDPHVSTADCVQLNESTSQSQDVLLPPSAFMTTGTQAVVIISCVAWPLNRVN